MASALICVSDVHCSCARVVRSASCNGSAIRFELDVHFGASRHAQDRLPSPNPSRRASVHLSSSAARDFVATSQIHPRRAHSIRANVSLDHGTALIGVIWRIVDQPQLQRVHFKCVGQFIHRAFDRISARTFSGRAHKRGLRDIHRMYNVIEFDRRRIVENVGCSKATRFHPIANRRRQHFARDDESLVIFRRASRLARSFETSASDGRCR